PDPLGRRRLPPAPVDAGPVRPSPLALFPRDRAPRRAVRRAADPRVLPLRAPMIRAARPGSLPGSLRGNLGEPTMTDTHRDPAPETPIELSVIVPCLNEELNIPELTDRVLGVFRQGELSGELLLVDDGSTDGTK